MEYGYSTLMPDLFYLLRRRRNKKTQEAEAQRREFQVENIYPRNMNVQITPAKTTMKMVPMQL